MSSIGPTTNPGDVDLRRDPYPGGYDTAGYQGGGDGQEEYDEQPALSDLLADLTRDVSDLMSTQVQLAVVELKEEARQAARAGTLLGASGLVAYLAVGLSAFSLAFGLAELVELWVAFLIVTAGVGVTAFVLYVAGRDALAATDPVPRQTIRTLEEDARWLRQQMS
jgi:uncharacterized membrane protein YqjE